MRARAASIAIASAAAAVAASVTAGGCMTGVPHCCAILSPTRYDAGIAVSDRGARVGHFAAGLSWASASANQALAHDVVLGALLDVRGDEADAEKSMAPPPAIGRYVFGGYLEGDARVGGGAHHRGWLGLRFEVVESYLDSSRDNRLGFGLTTRFAWEIERTGHGPTWTGAVGAGVFVEATSRVFLDNAVEHTVVTGISLRQPVKFIRTR